MGQYLIIGLVNEYAVEKKQVQKNNISEEELIAAMKSALHFESSIYDMSQTDEYYLFRLKSNVVEIQLLAFLTKFYPALYPDGDKEYERTLEMLKNSEPSGWIQLSKDDGNEEFQYDNYGEEERISFDKPFRPRISISYNTIMLSMEGKISMETYGRQFNFFKYCMQETFFEFSIAKALNVYIAG